MVLREVIGLLVVSASLGCPAPGEGAKAERGYHRAAPVIAALEGYRAATDTYPTSLLALIPHYLDSVSAPSAIEIQESPLGYVRSGADFELSFQYVGPGMNECKYHSSTKGWACSGHF